MQQIADWLEKLGLSEYADRFAENRIDFSVLPDLTDQDLEPIRKLLELDESDVIPCQALDSAGGGPDVET